MSLEGSGLLWVGFALGLAFGALARLGRFCLLRGLRQAMGQDAAEPRGSAPALQAFALALAVGLVGTQLMAWGGWLDVSQAVQARATFSPWGVLAGGLMFGAGMALAGSCGARALVLLGGGNLRALLTLLCLGLAAQAAMTGVLAPVRQWLQAWAPITLAQPTAVAAAQGAWGTAGLALVVGVPALLLLAYALRAPALRRSPAQWLGAIGVGVLVVAGWWLVAAGADPFDDRPLVSPLSFIAPMADSLLYVQMAVGRPVGLGMTVVLGVPLGAAAVALATRSLRWEGFSGPGPMLASATGGVLMGLGGAVALGCSVGQGLNGLALLAWTGMVAMIGIVLGAIFVIQSRSVWARRRAV